MQILNVYERTFALLVSQFRDSKADGTDSNFQKLIKAICSSLQDIENVNWELYSERWLDTAVGLQLDLIGELLGLPRLAAESDDDYRFRLRAQIFINIAKGTPEEQINLLRILTNASYVGYQEIPIAFFQLETNGTTFPTPWNDLNESIKSISPAGVSYAPITATLGVPIVLRAGGQLGLNPLLVSPDGIETALLEMEPYTAALYVSIGQIEPSLDAGVLEELNFPSPGAGLVSELIQIDGQSTPRRFE